MTEQNSKTFLLSMAIVLVLYVMSVLVFNVFMKKND